MTIEHLLRYLGACYIVYLKYYHCHIGQSVEVAVFSCCDCGAFRGFPEPVFCALYCHSSA